MSTVRRLLDPRRRRTVTVFASGHSLQASFTWTRGMELTVRRHPTLGFVPGSGRPDE